MKDNTDADSLIKLITETIAPASWKNTGGQGTIEYFTLRNSLHIDQTEDCQQQVAQLLAALRNMKEQEKLKGTWVSMSWEEAGEKNPKENADNFQVVFGNGDVTIRTGLSRNAHQWEQHTVTFRCNLDPTHDPKAIDLDMLGKVRRGIYEFDGKVLKLCLATDDADPRPHRFSTSGKDKYGLIVLKRLR